MLRMLVLAWHVVAKEIAPAQGALSGTRLVVCCLLLGAGFGTSWGCFQGRLRGTAWRCKSLSPGEHAFFILAWLSLQKGAGYELLLTSVCMVAGRVWIYHPGTEEPIGARCQVARVRWRLCRTHQLSKFCANSVAHRLQSTISWHWFRHVLRP